MVVGVDKKNAGWVGANYSPHEVGVILRWLIISILRFLYVIQSEDTIKLSFWLFQRE